MPRKDFIGHNVDPDEANKKLNLGAAMFGFANPAFNDEPGDENTPGPEGGEDPSAGYTSEIFGDGWEQHPAPSTGKRRRALWIGYHRGMSMMVIIFTTKTHKKSGGQRKFYGDSQPWIRYLDVSLEMWEELVGYHSTGEWLKFSGVENNYYYPTRAAEIDHLTQEYKEGLSS